MDRFLKPRSYLAVLLTTLSIIGLGVLAWHLFHHTTPSGHIVVSAWNHFELFMLMAGLFLSGYWAFGSRAVYLNSLILGMAFVVINPYFGPIDEGAHFAIVDFIAHHLKYPTIYDYLNSRMLALIQHTYPLNSNLDARTMGLSGHYYEAFQPPLYYLVATIVYLSLPVGMVGKVYGLRCLGVAMLLLSVYIARKTYALLVSNGIIKESDFAAYSVISLMFLNPGVLLRMSTIGNVNLLVPVVCLLVFYAIRILVRDEVLRRDWIILGILNACAVLTKFTLVFSIPFFVILVLIKSGFKRALLMVALIIILVAPWIVINLVNYGHLTANSLAESMIAAVVNPNHVQYGVAYVVNNIGEFMYSFWNPQEASPPHGILLLASDALSTIVFLALVIELANWRSLFREDRRQVLIVATSTLFFAANVGEMAFVTVSQNFPDFIGRYAYASVLPLSMTLLIHLSRKRKREVTTLGLISLGAVVIFMSSMSVRLLQAETFTVPAPPKIVSLGLSYYNNSHIKPGVMRKGQIVQTFISPYDNLEGLNLFLATYGQSIQTPYVFQLSNASGTVVRTVYLKSSEIKDMSFYSVLFPKISNSAHQHFSFTLYPDVKRVTTPLTFELGKPQVYKQGELTINGTRSNQDVVFELLYK